MISKTQTNKQTEKHFWKVRNIPQSVVHEDEPVRGPGGLSNARVINPTVQDEDDTRDVVFSVFEMWLHKTTGTCSVGQLRHAENPK